MTSSTGPILGFIGCGTLTLAIVQALSRYKPGLHDVLLSPRSEGVSRALAETFPRVQRRDSNAAVVQEADIVFLAVRPNQIDEAMAGLPFRAGQCVASFLAKTPIAEVARRAGPGPTVCRVTPLPSIALGKGPILTLDAPALVTGVFDGLGDVIAARDEAELTALGYASGLLSTYFEVQNTVIGWLGEHGAREAQASLYVRAMLEGLAATGKVVDEPDRPHLPAMHETRGGLNERSRRRLASVGWFTEIASTLDMLDQNVNLGPVSKKAQ